MRVTALFPMLCAVAAFVLGMLCLFAGHKPGFMEEYHIITLNTSTLGHNLIPTTTSSGAQATSTGFFTSILKNITSEVEEELNDIIGDIADKLAGELGIQQFYSLHLMDMCQGTYSPNATAKGAKANVTSCTNQTAMYHFDIEKQLNGELEAGPLSINLSDINWPDDIQGGLDKLNVAIDATFVLYAIGIAASGLAIITSLIAVFLHGSRLVSFGNLGLTSLAFLTLVVASVIVTVVQSKATGIINKYGNEIGVYAYGGKKYLVLTWVAAGLMGLASAAWVVEFCMGKKKEKRVFTEKTPHKSGSRFGFGGRKGSEDEAPFRRRGV